MMHARDRCPACGHPDYEHLRLTNADGSTSYSCSMTLNAFGSNHCQACARTRDHLLSRIIHP